MGARFSHVRIVDEPPTDGQRFLMATAAGNVDAGEDLRIRPSTPDAERRADALPTGHRRCCAGTYAPSRGLV
ncbi:DUF6879 family protein [Streptomyces sp. NPDC057717]|uniref:DUF6879 family protein n=1 Tax=Streptomyces sp. NPDC057717 TaxID=3346224 RepID=UPI0036B7B35E